MNQEYDVQLSFEELVHACDNDRQWVVSLIEENAISISGEPHLATFSGYQLARVRRARRLPGSISLDAEERIACRLRAPPRFKARLSLGDQRGHAGSSFARHGTRPCAMDKIEALRFGEFRHSRGLHVKGKYADFRCLEEAGVWADPVGVVRDLLICRLGVGSGHGETQRDLGGAPGVDLGEGVELGHGRCVTNNYSTVRKLKKSPYLDIHCHLDAMYQTSAADHIPHQKHH